MPKMVRRQAHRREHPHPPEASASRVARGPPTNSVSQRSGRPPSPGHGSAAQDHRLQPAKADEHGHAGRGSAPSPCAVRNRPCGWNKSLLLHQLGKRTFQYPLGAPNSLANISGTSSGHLSSAKVEVQRSDHRVGLPRPHDPASAASRGEKRAGARSVDTNLCRQATAIHTRRSVFNTRHMVINAVGADRTYPPCRHGAKLPLGLTPRGMTIRIFEKGKWDNV